MTTTDIAHRAAGSAQLREQMEYAQALAQAGTLPEAYRKRPADLLLAMAYADSLGIPLAQALTGIHVINGKPAMSAELMRALVLRAGHRLRITATDTEATCSIVRCDDPEFVHAVTFTTGDADRAGLKGGNWAKFPKAMLTARATSAAIRQACPDVLAGVSYIPEELARGGFITAAADPVQDDDPSTAVPKPEVDAVDAVDEVFDEEWRVGWHERLEMARDNPDRASSLQQLAIIGAEAARAGRDDMAAEAREEWVRRSERKAN